MGNWRQYTKLCLNRLWQIAVMIALGQGWRCCVRMSSYVDALIKTWLNTANFLDLALVKRCDCLEGLRFRLKEALI